MRTIHIALAFALAAVTFVGCSEKKKTDDIITRKVTKPAVKSPVRMQEYSQTKHVEWRGASLTCEIKRSPSDSLPMVKDETGQKYVDNIVTLSITRNDGSPFVKRTFTKKAFDDCLDNDYRKTGVLEGFVFDRVDGQCLRFAASVCHPQNEDEFIPIVVKVSPDGSLSIARDTQMDTNGTTAEEE